MASYRRHYQRVTHRPPNAADARGLLMALQALHSSEPMTPEEVAAHEHEASLVPYRKVQGDLPLVLPERKRT